jgi:hypothetical protein
MVIILTLSIIPYIAGVILTPEGSYFTGNLLNRTDTFSYFAEMQIGLRGDWLFIMPYSPIPNKPIPLFMLYILLGHLARLTNLPIPLVFHGARLVFSGFFIFLGYRFIARSTSAENEQKLALGFLLFTAGYGWLMIILLGTGATPDYIPDIWIFDAISFGAILGFPHFVLNMALMLWLLMAGEDFINTNSRLKALSVIIASVLIAFIHPHQLVIIGIVIAGSTTISNKERIKEVRYNLVRLIAVFFPATCITITLMVMSYSDGQITNWISQGNTYTPPPWSLLILYGPVLVLAIFGLIQALRAPSTKLIPVILWFLSVAFLLYVPVNFQRRFIEGWHIPVAILASIGWFRYFEPRISNRVSVKFSKYLLIALFITVIISPIFLLATTIGTLTIKEGSKSPYLTAEERGAIDYLVQNTGNNKVIMSAFYNGNLLPAFSPVRSFLGHWDQTPSVRQRFEEITKFFDLNMSDEYRITLLNTYHIGFVYVSHEEQSLGKFSPENAEYLLPVFESPGITIFKTNIREYSTTK